jgi:anti-sigma factor RsiW
MSDCRSIDPLITPYVDGELGPGERDRVDAHLGACPPCRDRAAAEQSVQRLIAGRHHELAADRAPEILRARCHTLTQEMVPAARPNARVSPPGHRTRFAQLAFAATLVLIVAGAFVYQLTAHSPRVMAAELTADHMKCFALNGLLGTHEAHATVEAYMASGFGWQTHLPEDGDGLELIGSRACLYGEGRVAHIMFRHNGRPVSLFMLPRHREEREVIDLFGHEAAIWSDGERTFVLVAGEARPDVDRLVSVVQASLRSP